MPSFADILAANASTQTPGSVAPTTGQPPGASANIGSLSFLGSIPGQQMVGDNGDLSSNVNKGMLTMSGGYDSATDPDLLAHLKEVQKYDPSATIHQNDIQQGDATKQAYNLQFNQDLLPHVQGAQALVPQSGDYSNWNSQQIKSSPGEEAIIHQVNDPSKITNNQYYGNITDADNVATAHVFPKGNALDKYGPMLPLLAAGGLPMLFEGAGLTAGGAAAGGLLGDTGAASAGSAASTGSSAFGNAARQAVGSSFGQLNSGKFDPTAYLNAGYSATGLPSWSSFISNSLRSGS